MKKFFLFLALSALTTFWQLYAKTIPVDSFDRLVSEIMELENRSSESQSSLENTLVVFDVDEVLIAPDDTILRSCGHDLLQQHLHYHQLHKDNERQHLLTSIIMQDAKRSLIDKDIPEIIQWLQKMGVKVIALTAIKPQNFGKIASVPDWRINELKNHGISFEDAFPSYPTKPIVLDPNDRKLPPLFKKGIIFSDLHEKGKVLAAFLKELEFYPEQLIFIDDRAYNIRSMDSEMTKLGIKNVVCMHYSGAELLENSLDLSLEEHREIVSEQISCLIHEHRWITEEEARNRLLIGTMRF